MKTQLLMIIAIVVSSLLTISQRATAQEISQLRWLEPTVEQEIRHVIVPDQDNDLDDGYVASITFHANTEVSNAPDFFCYQFSAISKVKHHTHSRAPPFSLI